MADEPKDQSTPPSLAPAEATPPAGAAPTVPADPLSDGTVPTVLTPGSSHKSVPKGRASIAGIYRRADIMTTLITFVASIIAAGAIFGAYSYLTRTKTPTTKTPTVTTLSQSDLDKLGAFFEGDSAGSTSQVLTINASSLFKSRVGVSSDLKVQGGVQVDGTTALGDLTVDKVSTLGVTNVRGAVTVAGPSSLQGPTLLGNGVSVTGNATVSGNGSFGGSLAAGVINTATLSVTSALNLTGHISVSGPNPTMSGGTITGTDTSGSFTMTGVDATVTFHAAYTRTPHVVISPNAPCTANAGQFFVQETGGGGFLIHNPDLCTGFNYWVAQ